MQYFHESRCSFAISCDRDRLLKIDESDEYRKISSIGLKAADFVFVKHDRLYIVEIKCWEYFDPFIDDKDSEESTKRLRIFLDKLIHTLYIVCFSRSNEPVFEEFRNVLTNTIKYRHTIYFVIVVCPPCYREERQKEVKFDSFMGVKEFLYQRLKSIERVVNCKVVVDAPQNVNAIFDDIRPD